MSFDDSVTEMQKARINREFKSLPNFMNNLSDESIDLLLVVKRRLDSLELNLDKMDICQIHNGHLSDNLHLKQRSAALMIMLAIALKSIDDFNALIIKANRAALQNGLAEDLSQFKLEATKFTCDIKAALDHVNIEKISEAITIAQNQMIPDFVSRIHYFHGQFGQNLQTASIRPLFNY